MSEQKSAPKSYLKISRISWIFSVLLLGALIILVVTRFGEVSQFILLAQRARPMWLLLAVLLQMGTYGCLSAIWHFVAKSAGYRLKPLYLIRLAIEKLSINQLVPTGGISGDLIVVRAMTRLGIPAALAMEAILIDLLTRYMAYTLVAAITVLLLWWYHHITPLVLGLVGVFAIIAAVIPLIVILLVRFRTWQPPPWLYKYKLISSAFSAIAHISPKRLKSAGLLSKTSLLQLAIFLLDSATLWVVMLSIGMPINPLTAFSALVIGSIAATVFFLPGGVGSFEAGCIATLSLLKTPVEAALVGTLLLRGLTLWLPLIPGMILARRDMKGK